MRNYLIALGLAAIMGFAAMPMVSAAEFSGETSITEHHWGRGSHRGRRGGRGWGYHRGDGYVDGGSYYEGGYCY